MKAESTSPYSVDQFGRIKSTTPSGTTIVYHTIPRESADFFSKAQALSLGRKELGLLISLTKSGGVTAPDGRTKQQLEHDWLAAVTSTCTLTPQQAEAFLRARLNVDRPGCAGQ